MKIGAMQEAASTDAALVERTLGGDDRAFRTLYDRHHVVVARRLRRLLGPGQDYEDVLQVTFVEAHRYLARFDRSRSFGAWLHGIAFRQAANHLRRARRRRWLRLGPVERPATDASAEDQAIRRQLLSRLYEAMDRLPPKKRIAFSLHVLDGLGFAEIGHIVDASPQTVRARVVSGREAVLAHLCRAMRRVPLDVELTELLA